MKEYIDKHEVYDTLANKLTWLMSLGDEVYLSVGNEIRNVLNEQPTITETDIIAKATKCPIEMYADSTLFRMTKADLIETIKCYRHNQAVAYDTIDTQYVNFQKLLKEERAKAIDEFVENISLEISESLIWGMIADCFKYKNMSDTSDKIIDYIIETSKKIAEQLKVGD